MRAHPDAALADRDETRCRDSRVFRDGSQARRGADDEDMPQIAISHLRDSSHSVFATGGTLFWNKAEPSSELTTGAEDFCVDDGGWGDAAGWQRTGRNPSLPQKPGYTSPTFACSHAGSQELDIKKFFLIQALRSESRPKAESRSNPRDGTQRRPIAMTRERLSC